LAPVTLPANATVRARGFVTGGGMAPWFVETIVVPQVLPPDPPQILLSDGGFALSTNRFGFDLTALPGQIVIIEASTNLSSWMPLQTNGLESGAVHFRAPAGSAFPWRFYRARLQ
jgi:hypothetical protein